MQRLRSALSLLLLVAVLGGCRTYGGHGNEEAVYEAILAANRDFAEALETASQKASLLADAVEANPGLLPFATAWQSLVTAHSVVLEEHTRMAEQLDGSGNYRMLNHVLGNIVIDHQTFAQHYDRLLTNVVEAGETPIVTQRQYNFRSLYTIAPPYYYRTERAERRPTVELALSRLNALSPDSLSGRLASVLPPPTADEIADPGMHPSEPGGPTGSGLVPEHEGH